MKLESLHVGMKVRHPRYGVGTVKTIGEHTAEIRFDEGLKTIAPETAELSPAEPQAALSGLTVPLQQLIDDTARAVIDALGWEKPGAVVDQLAQRWQQGTLVLRPHDPALLSKEIPVEVLFHKIVMMRNNLRVLEQKVNGHDKLSEADRIDLQQYITRCYGSMTTFNLLFKDKNDQFAGSTAG
jgi:hypothetical protein